MTPLSLFTLCLLYWLLWFNNDEVKKKKKKKKKSVCVCVCVCVHAHVYMHIDVCTLSGYDWDIWHNGKSYVECIHTLHSHMYMFMS